MNLFLSALGTSIFWIALILFFSRFLSEVKLLNNESGAKVFFINSLKTTTVGLLVFFIGFIIYNLVVEATNFFNFEALFANEYITRQTDAFKNLNIIPNLKIGVFPLCSVIVHFAGKLLFDTYMPTAVFLNFVCACVFVHFMYLTVKNRCDEKSADKAVNCLLFFPLSLMLFVPGQLSMLMALSAGSIYYCEQNKIRFSLVFAVLACLCGMQGAALLLFIALYKRLKDNTYYIYILLAFLLGFIPFGQNVYIHNMIFIAFVLPLIKHTYSDFVQSTYIVISGVVTASLLYATYALNFII